MQIRATVKWRQSLPLTRLSTPSLSLSPLPLLILPSSLDPGVFQLLTLFPSFSPLHPPTLLLNHFLLLPALLFLPFFYPPSSRCSLSPSLTCIRTPLLSLATPPSPLRLAPDFHTPATALPAQVEGGNTRPPACFRNASAPACTTRRIYIHCNFIGRSCWHLKTQPASHTTSCQQPFTPVLVHVLVSETSSRQSSRYQKHAYTLQLSFR